MSLDAPSRPSPVITSVDELVDWIRLGEKPRSLHLCGLETEKLGFDTATGEAAPLEAIGALLRGLADEDGDLLVENGAAIGVQLPRSSVALEPGGQLELSGTPARTLAETRTEIARHVEAVERLSEPLGVTFVATGYRPWGERANVPWLPRGRYGLMRKNLPGGLAHDMMQLTASVQANFDFENEEDCGLKVGVATAVSPVVSALVANSPLRHGAPSGYQSFRYHVWSDVDPSRCGLVRAMYEPGFTYRKYVEWALSAPLLFVRRQGDYHDAGGRTLRDLLRDGFMGEPATMQDFVDLLSTLFPEIRVKRVIEVRGADAVDADTTLALGALWTGLLYDRQAATDARALVTVPFDELVAFQEAVARDALDARLDGVRAQDLAKELLRLAEDGLRRRTERGEAPDERPLLAPLQEIAATGRTPADRLLEAFHATGGDRAALLRAMRY